MKPLQAVLPNGLEIIAQPMPAARSTAVAVLLRSGARADVQLGTAHFLEHMLFKGAANFSALELSQAFDAIGAHANAFTSHENTTYTAAALPKQQSRLTELLLGMMQPKLNPTDIELERNVILEEIELYRDDPMSIALESSAAHYFQHHPLGRPVIGTKQTVSSISQADLQTFLTTQYGTANMVMAVCGIFDWQRLLEDVAQFSENIVRGARTQPSFPSFTPKSGLQIIHHDSAHTQISFIASGFAAGHPLELPAAIAARIIGDSENSRFAWALVNDGTALAAGLEHEGHSDIGAFYGSIECPNEHAQTSLERVQAALQQVKTKGISAAELERMKRKLEVGIALRLETPSAWLGAFAEDYLMQNDLRPPAVVLEELRAVSLEQVNAALEMSGLENPLFVVLGES